MGGTKFGMTDPRCCRKSIQTHDTVHGTWMTVSVSLFIATANRSSLASFAGAAKPFSNERHPYLLVDVKSLDVALHSIQRHLQTKPTTSPASFAPLQLPYTIMVYGLTSYIHEYFTHEYFNITVPSNREFKNAKIANLQNINSTKIKVHMVCTICPTEKHRCSPLLSSAAPACHWG